MLRSPGQELQPEVRSAFEGRFRHDFGDVRVHADERAAESARMLGARAYTVDGHIAFNRNEYAPATAAGQALLAHELAHVVQQGRSRVAGTPLHRIDAGEPHDRVEHDGRRMGAAALAGRAGAGELAARAPAHRVHRQAAATTAPASTAAGGPRAAPFQWAYNVDLGQISTYYHGTADARLDRRPVLDQKPQAGGRGRQDSPPCQLDLFLNLEFHFHQGPKPFGTGEPGPPWPAAQAAEWKRAYVQQAQQMWRTRQVLERSGACGNEPCSRAVGQLHVIDAATSTDATGQPAPAGASRFPHYTVDVYEQRPEGFTSKVSGSRAELYREDVIPRGTARPPDLDPRLGWEPGSAAHETGHMLGRPHVACGPNAQNPNAEECYGRIPDERANVMGRGSGFRPEDHAPFVAGLRATTGCDWRTPSRGWPWWAWLLLAIPVVGWIGLGIAALAGQL